MAGKGEYGKDKYDHSEPFTDLSGDDSPPLPKEK